MTMKHALCAILIGVAFGGCATSDVNYADRNNVDTVRARCIQLARDSGYQDISTESINRDGQTEWKVGLLVRRDEKDQKEKCEYDARTERVHLG